MASIHKQTLPSGNRSYYVKYVDPSGVRRTKRFKTLEAARAFSPKVQTSVTDGSWVDPALGRVTLREFTDHVLKTADIRPSTRAVYETHNRLYVEPRLGARRLTSLTPSDVRTFISGLQDDGIGASTVVHVHQFLRKVLTIAVEEERITKNPASRIRIAKAKEREPFFLTEAQVSAIAREANGYAPLVKFLAWTGLRIGEASALRVKNLDLLRGEVRVVENATEVAGRLVTGRPKTARGTRNVPVPTILRDELTQLVAGKDQDDLVFSGPGGGQLRGTAFRNRGLYKAAERAGVLRDGKPPHPHDLRHTFASLMSKAGFNLFEVSRMMGHASIDITADRYTHLFPEERSAKHDRVDAMFAEAESGTDGEVVDLAERRGR